MALESKLTETNTIKRINKLTKLEILEKKFAEELIESFDTLLNLD